VIILRPLAYLLSAVTIVAAVFMVPMPLVEFSPGGATPVRDLIALGDEVATTPIEGELSLLTIKLTQPTAAEVVRAWTTPVRDVELRTSVIPAGIDDEDYFDYQRGEFQRTFELAVAVGLRAAGAEVSVRSAPIVVHVLSAGPAEGVLQAGDLVRTFDGQPVASAEELVEAASDLDAGETVPLTVDRAGETLELELTAARLAELDRPGLGIRLGTTSDAVDLPFDIDMSDTRIGGPSAGMMIALTVYDLFSDEDLAAGRHIAGTGTVDQAGRVGPVGGIQEKVVSAADAGATVLLVPASLAAEARSVQPPGLEIVPVASVDEAIAALRGGD
jgi:PDZ domain-containing protein